MHGGIYTTEYDLIHDQNSSAKKIEHPWEECRGMGSSFGYNRNEGLEDYNSSAELIKILIDKVSRGGNLLLNIGPTADGRIPVIMQQRLLDMGEWLRVNGEAIYGTRAWDKAPAQKDKDVFYTIKGNDLYILFTKYPVGKFSVPGIKSPTQVNLLGSQEKVKFSGNNITAPVITPADQPCDHAWVFKVANALK